MRTVVIAAAILIVAILVWTIHPTNTAQRNRNAFQGANQPVPVGVAQATQGPIDVTLNALGTVTPLATVVVKPQVSGPIVKIAFTEGQMVRPGEVLAEIDPKPYQAALDQAKGQLARDQAALANARVDLARYQTLIKENSIAQQQVDTQAALVRQDEAVVKTDQANVEAAQINLNYTSIKSPIAGRLGLRQVDLGNLVTAGQATGIVVVTQLQPISVIFTVPEDNIDTILARMRQGATLPATALDRAQMNTLAKGQLATVDNQVDTSTGTVKLRAIFDNSGNALFPNQFVNIRLLVNTLQNQTIVPTAAIQRGQEGTFVYVVGSDHIAHMRKVALGDTQDDRVAIRMGVSPGETVVTDGADRLREGSHVVLPGEAAPQVAQAGARGRRGQGGGGTRRFGPGGAGGATGAAAAGGGPAAPAGGAAAAGPAAAGR
jgi:multidrug efflux system membrane fusion protein